MRTIIATLHSKFIHNSLALPCLVAYCGDDCGELLIREFTVHEPRESILAMLLGEDPDVVAFSVYLWNRQETLNLVDALAVARPGLRIVLGGPEISYDQEDIFNRHPGLTAMIRGEGEEPLRTLLRVWYQDLPPAVIPRTVFRHMGQLISGPDSPPLADLDDIPSPFQLGLCDLTRGFVYYETSRGCPYQCSFCLSARDNLLRSYSMERIRSDLLLLIQNHVPQVKLVDRTFNYNTGRALQIFRFILEHNRFTRFHFEIAAHLLDDTTLELLETMPHDMFQFEIGVQTTLESTLDAIDRRVDMARLAENVCRLVKSGGIHLHLDLVAGLPGESFENFIASIDRVMALEPHHLQIEPVKLLPGSPLRDRAKEHGISFDPNPPYTILGSPDLSYADLQQIQEISRLLDLTYNSGCFATFLHELADVSASFARGILWLVGEWRRDNLFRFPQNRKEIFNNLARIVARRGSNISRHRLTESLAYDYARCERVVTNRIPDFFDTVLSLEERLWVKNMVRDRTAEIRGKGIKLQYFAAVFSALHNEGQRTVCLFLYLTQTRRKMQVEEYHFCQQL